MSINSRKSTATVSASSSSKNGSVVLRRSAPKPRVRKSPVIPWAAHWGWSHLPFAAKVLILGVFCGAVSVTTPFWAYIKTDTFGYATYGLWHFCRGEQCGSVHDNILDGKSVPVWYHMVQGSMCIGVACSIIGLAVLTNSIEGTVLKMTVTVHRTCACVLGISAAEHFMALYVFVIYLEETDFLFDRMMSTYELDFHGSFYAGIISFSCSLIAALVVYADNSIHKIAKPVAVPQFDQPPPYEAYDNYCYSPGDDESLYGEVDYLLYQHGYDRYGGWHVDHIIEESGEEQLDEDDDDPNYDDPSFQYTDRYPLYTKLDA